MALDPSKIPALVVDLGLEPMMAAYTAEETVRQRIFTIRNISPAGDALGWRETIVVGDNIPSETRYGQDAPQRTMTQGYVAYGRQRKLQMAMVIPEEIWKSPRAEEFIRKMVLDVAGPWGQGFQIAKERGAAALFNKGALAAGDVDTFDGSHGGLSGAVDPHPGYIYDGKPLFAASGNGHPLYLASSVTKYNLVVSDALSSTTLEASRVLMSSTNAVDENNQLISIVPRALVVPPGLTQTAEVLVGSIQQPGTANNDVNTARGRYDVIQWRYITDTDSWFMGVNGKGLVFADSGDPTIEVSAPDAANGNITVRMLSYWGAWANDWRYWTAHNQATS